MMAPCGYRIENGIAVIDEKKPQRLRNYSSITSRVCL